MHKTQKIRMKFSLNGSGIICFLGGLSALLYIVSLRFGTSPFRDDEPYLTVGTSLDSFTVCVCCYHLPAGVPWSKAAN